MGHSSSFAVGNGVVRHFQTFVRGSVMGIMLVP
jgi:hypothetical protein